MLRKNLTSQILVAILRGELAGGNWLVEQELAARFGVSRTPIREAINQLSSFGVVRIYPNRGTQVQPFGPSQLRDIYVVRGILETEATRRACGRIPEEMIRQLHHQMDLLMKGREDSADWAQQQGDLDRELHDIIGRHCDSGRLHTELQRYWVLIDAIRMSLGHRYEVRAQALREHLQIMEALLRQDAEGAAKLMIHHIAQTGEAAVNHMFGNVKDQTKPGH